MSTARQRGRRPVVVVIGVAVAAAVYEGIQGAIRRNGYDNIRLRAVTSTPRKIALALGAILSSDWRGSRRHQKVPLRSSHPRFVA